MYCLNKEDNESLFYGMRLQSKAQKRLVGGGKTLSNIKIINQFLKYD